MLNADLSGDLIASHNAQSRLRIEESMFPVTLADSERLSEGLDWNAMIKKAFEAVDSSEDQKTSKFIRFKSTVSVQLL